MNIRKLFLQLTSYTIPNGMEHTLEKFFPKDIQEDGCGNYYITIGDSKTIFTCHMDTACYKYEKVNHVIKNNMISTDGSTVLSGDDKNGMTILLYMIYRRIPGTYYFFQGEESGLIGADAILASNKEFFLDFDRMVSFDRRGYSSIITHQMGSRGCSEEFSMALADELGYQGLPYKSDSTGIFTDSADFIGIIPEVTNLSVGYFNEHTHQERTDISFLERLARAVCSVNWESLPIGENREEDMRYAAYKDQFGCIYYM